MIFSEACNQVGYNPDYSNAPTRIYTYFAYKDGQSFECFSKAEAQKISHLIEYVLVNKDEIDQYAKNQNALLNKAIQLWKDNLREEHSSIPERVYNICYEKAYDRAHAYGYDEVASTLKDEIEFACKLLNL
jgi:hypothetical protein